MKSILLSLALLLFLSSYSQETVETGIHFEHGSNWLAIKEKAKKEKKFIFMDAFTTWCGPCRMMAKEVFPKPEVGQFFNAKYLSVKVQLDTTNRDNEEVKKWYADAHTIMTQYHVSVFPTYLFFSPDGKLVHRSVGASDAQTFIIKGKDALDPSKQYYTLKASHDKGNRNPAFLNKLTKAAQQAYDLENMRKYCNEYLATQKNLLTPENIKFMKDFTFSSNDKGFQMMLKHPKEMDAVLGQGVSQFTVRAIIMQEDIYPVIWGPGNGGFIWNDLEKKVVAKYPSVGAEVVEYAKVFFYQQQGDWDNFAPAVVDYMSKYGHNVTPAELNSFAWAIFQNCDDMACIEKAIDWGKRAAATHDPNFMDTYANLLYKAGKKEEAIKAQEQTIAIAKAANNSNIEEFESTLEKMKKGEKTW